MRYSWSELFDVLCFLSFLVVTGNMILAIISAILRKESANSWSDTWEFIETGVLVWLCPVLVLVLISTPFYLLYLLYKAVRAIIG